MTTGWIACWARHCTSRRLRALASTPTSRELPTTGSPTGRSPAAEVDEQLQHPLQWLDGERAFLVGLADRNLTGATLPLAACLAISLTTFFQVRSHFDDWRRLHTKRSLPPGPGRSGDRLEAPPGTRRVGHDPGSIPGGVVHFEAALKAITPDDPEYTASSLAGLAYVYRLLGTTRRGEPFRVGRTARPHHGNMNCLIYVTCGIGVPSWSRET
jgi:hypothetical protein